MKGEPAMRYPIVLAIFALVTVLSGSSQDIPPGTYRDSCRNIKMRGDQLRARCQTSQGNWVKTSLNSVDRCVGDITNVEGQLTCSQNSGPPEGTYTQSCKNIRVRYNTLYARCKTMNGQWVDTSLSDYNRCSGGIGNFDGQ